MGLGGSKTADPEDPVENENVPANETVTPTESENVDQLSSTNIDGTSESEELNTADIITETSESQGVSASDSTLESEIDALSKIITEAKEEVNKSTADFNDDDEKCANEVDIEDNFNDACIDTIVEKNSESEPEKKEKSEEFQEEECQDENSKNTLINIQDESSETVNVQNSTHSSVDSRNENIQDVENDSPNPFVSAIDESESKNNSNVSTVSNLNNSLLMIGEAYISEDSQGSDYENPVDSETTTTIDSKTELIQNVASDDKEEDISDKCTAESIDENVDSTEIVTTDEIKNVDEPEVSDCPTSPKDAVDPEAPIESNSINEADATENVSNPTVTDVQSVESIEPLPNIAAKLNLSDSEQNEELSSTSPKEESNVSLEEIKDSNKICSEEDDITLQLAADGNSEDFITETNEMLPGDEAEEIQNTTEVPTTIDCSDSTFDDKLQESSDNLQELNSAVADDCNVAIAETVDDEVLNAKQQDFGEKIDEEEKTDIVLKFVDEEKQNDLEDVNPSDVNSEEIQHSEEKVESLLDNTESTDISVNTLLTEEMGKIENSVDILNTEISTENVISDNQNEDTEETTNFTSLGDVLQLEEADDSESNKEKCDAPCESDIQENEEIPQVKEVSSLHLPESDEKLEENETAVIESPEIETQLENQPPEQETTDIFEDSQNDLKLEENVLSENKSKDIDSACDPESIFANPDASELESAVKFLQESEEQITDSSLELAPKMKVNVDKNLSEQENFFISEKMTNESNLEIVSGIESITESSIAISEAEIISEAAKLESERKATQSSIAISEAEIISEAAKLESERKAELSEETSNTENIPNSSESSSTESESQNKINQESALRTSEVPFSFKTSVLEERLKEPPKIVIPNQDVVKTCDSSPASKSSLLIQKDAKQTVYSKVECSIKAAEKGENSRKDEKTDSENVGSPRIILKIAKSAITDCGEPKSPKSPKVRSAANSPNPDDSPGQKLGKIKLKLSKSGHLSIVSNENVEEVSHRFTESATPTLSPLGMKIKLSKSGEASVIQAEKVEDDEQVEQKPEEGKKSECTLGMKIKLTKFGDASIVSQDAKEILPKSKEKSETTPEVSKKSEASLGMKLKLSKTGDVSIVSSEKQEPQQELTKRTESPLGMKIKLLKGGDASIVSSDCSEEAKVIPLASDKRDTIAESDKFRSESPVGMKIKLTKTKGGSAMVLVDSAEERTEKLDVPDNTSKRTESALGMKIKLSKSGDASIIHQEDPEGTDESAKQKDVPETAPSVPAKSTDSIGMTIKVSKTGEATILHCKSADLPEKLDHSEESKGKDSHSETLKTVESSSSMKIKLVKTSDTPTVQHEIITETEAANVEQAKKQKTTKDSSKRPDEHSLEMKIKLSKTGHPTIVICESHSDSSSSKTKETFDTQTNLPYKFNEAKKEELYSKDAYSFAPQNKESEVLVESPSPQIPKKDVSKEICHKRKEISFSPSEPKKLKFETNLSNMLPEVTIQPVASKLQKRIILESSSSTPLEKIKINQEVSITEIKSKVSIKPLPTTSVAEDKVINKMFTSSPTSSDCEIIEHRPELVIVNENSNSSQDVVIIEEVPSVRMMEVKIPKKRGRPRRNDTTSRFVEPIQIMLPRDPLALDDASTLSQEPKENERPRRTCRSQKSYAPPKRGRGGRGRGKRKLDNTEMLLHKKSRIEQDLTAIEKSTMSIIAIDRTQKKIEKIKEKLCDIPMPSAVTLIKDVSENLPSNLEKISEKMSISNYNKEELGVSNDNDKNNAMINDHQNWLTPTSKKVAEPSTRNESISTVQVIDEETRMSAESGSRSQTPARNITVSETVINEESQGSVLSTATTESERVKVKNRRMEINFDPDEGSFTVDKIAEYEWPVDRKGETFMVQEQISQYLGVKSFKRKYPDLKRRIVDMEERNFLRENALVSEAMCDMGLTALPSSEVLDIMCSDFPDQYEEYRKHMREKQVKEHSKKQKELTAAANAERNRIDLAEMAMQSALSWNVNLNRARMDNRKSSLDLQTFTIHLPKKEPKVEADRSSSYYPVALIPGQFTDYYREYTPAELRYYPLNTVLYGPMKPNEQKFDSQSEGSQSDSDSDSSSDDSSSSSSDGTQGTEASQSTMDDVDMELVLQKTEAKSVKLIC